MEKKPSINQIITHINQNYKHLDNKGKKTIVTLGALAGVLVVLLVVLLVAGHGISNVGRLRSTHCSDTSIHLAWRPIHSVDGYNVYTVKESGERKLVATTTEPQATVKGLPSGKQIDFGVTGYKTSKKGTREGMIGNNLLRAYTLPSEPDLISLTGTSEKLQALWTPCTEVVGYEVEYSADKHFSKGVEKTFVSGGTVGSYSVMNLKVGTTYYLRLRSMVDFDGLRVYSHWSTARHAEITNLVIDPNKPMVALTFDDGPSFVRGKGNSTAKILHVLEKYNARATFFMVGNRVDSYTARFVKKEVKMGCQIGNHSYDHKTYGKNVTAKSIKKASTSIKKYAGVKPTVFRCPGGIMSPTIMKECKREGMPIAYWSVDTQDWYTKNPKKIYKAVKENVKDGDILLFHDIYPTTATAIKKVVPYLVKKGYQLVTVEELITYKSGKAPKPGNQYVNYKIINNHTR